MRLACDIVDLFSEWYKFQPVFASIVTGLCFFGVHLAGIPPFTTMEKDQKKSSRPPRDLRLKEIPADVIDVIYDVQNELKKTAGRHVSLEKAFCRLVREFKKQKEV